MKIYTKTGDTGSTSLFSGERIPKHSKRIDLYGTIDELVAAITLAMEFEPSYQIGKDLEEIIHKLFMISADFATSIGGKNADKIVRISAADVTKLERLIDYYTTTLPELKSFIQPSGSKCAAFINWARTICRRAERIATELILEEELNEAAVCYLNRLSDYLFTAMRKELQ